MNKKDMEIHIKRTDERLRILECGIEGHVYRYQHGYTWNVDSFAFEFKCISCKKVRTYYGWDDVPDGLKLQIKAITPRLDPKFKKGK